ncbi:Epoxide hydrolase-like protein 1 [Elsinoe fawcettii]|nr:Epoxide hydrolase-like protein 1 [Elsinoe fawcettii]
MTSTSRPGQDVDGIEEYRMHVSQRYLDLTKKKLELARLPKELSDDEDVNEESHGVTKAELEPLLDFWLDGFDFRAQEAHLNRQLPQYRTTLRWSRSTGAGDNDQSLRLHFVHRKSTYKNAVPLLFVHDWGTSFVEVARVIESLCEPVSTPTLTQSDFQAFNVVSPSIPGFGFGDPIRNHSAGIEDVACVFQCLMDKLGYNEYVAYGAGWGYRIIRTISRRFPACKAIYTTNPLVPAPNLFSAPLAYLQYHIARFTNASIPLLSFGYVPSDFLLPTTMQQSIGAILLRSDRNNTGVGSSLAFSLADSPTGLLAFMLQLINPPSIPAPQPPASSGEQVTTNPFANPRSGSPQPFSPRVSSPLASPPPRSSLAPSPSARSPLTASPLTSPPLRSPLASPPLTSSFVSTPSASTLPPSSTDALERGRIDSLYPTASASLAYPWSPSDILTWTMLYWLSGPEAPLRWLRNASKETGAGSEYWTEKSGVPVGVSFFRTSPHLSQHASTGNTGPGEGTSAEDVALHGTGARAKGKKRRRNQEGALTGRVSPPVWVGAWGNLTWLRRHETGREVKWPAWERGEVLVADLREFVGEVRREGYLS